VLLLLLSLIELYIWHVYTFMILTCLTTALYAIMIDVFALSALSVTACKQDSNNKNFLA
jgi:hypothetical protein